MLKNSFILAVSSFGLFACGVSENSDPQMVWGDLVQTVSSGPQYGLAAPGSCMDARGQVVEMIALPTESLAREGGFLAVSFLSDGHDDPVILYDEDLMSYMHPLTQRFILDHECAHHEQGHLYANPSQQSYWSVEGEADCIAIDKMRRNSSDPDGGIEVVVADLNTFFSLNSYLEAGFVTERVESVLGCFENSAPSL